MPALLSTANICSKSPATEFRRSIRKTGDVVATVPTPDGGASGMAWAEGTLWVAQYRNRKIHQVDPQTGAILRTIESNRFVTGVTWVGDELWHGTWEADQSELRHIDSKTGEVLEQLDMPAGIAVSGLEFERQRYVLLRRRQQWQAESRSPAQPRVQSSVRTIDYYRWGNIIFRTLPYWYRSVDF